MIFFNIAQCNTRHNDLFNMSGNNLCSSANRLFAGQGHVNVSMIKIGVSSKWQPEMKRA